MAVTFARDYAWYLGEGRGDSWMITWICLRDSNAGPALLIMTPYSEEGEVAMVHPKKVAVSAKSHESFLSAS